MTTRKYSSDIIEDLYREINKLNDKIDKFLANVDISAPPRDSENLPPGVEGMVVIAGVTEAGPMTGIFYDMDNEGGYLLIGTNNNISSGPMAPSSMGLMDTGGGGGIGMWDGNMGSGITLIAGAKGSYTFGAGGVQLISTAGGMHLFCDNAPFEIVNSTSGFILLHSDTSVTIEGDSGVSLQSGSSSVGVDSSAINIGTGSGSPISITSGQAITIQATSALNLFSGGTSDVTLSPATGSGHGYIVMLQLPTSSPGLPHGRIWNNGGVLNVT